MIYMTVTLVFVRLANRRTIPLSGWHRRLFDKEPMQRAAGLVEKDCIIGVYCELQLISNRDSTLHTRFSL